MAKSGDKKIKNDKPATKNTFLKKNVFDTTAEKIDNGIAAMQLKGEKLGIAEFIDKAVDALIEKNNLKVS